MSSTSAPTADAGAAISGKVRGGQQAIAGAHVYLLAANTTGYAGPGVAASSSNASLSLLTSSGTTLDTSGGPTNGDYYVTTDSNGLFSITGDYSCTSGQQVYLYALGGNPGGGTNSAAGLLEILGNCPGGNSAFVSADPSIVVNEVTTIAAAYAFAGFATDATHVSSSGTGLAQTGIANAFANAGSLANIVSGGAYSTTPTANSTGTVPQSEINTLANILASCVNSIGPSSSACSTLLADAESSGSSGTAPTDTATAAINMAHNPSVNIAALYALSIPTPPFAPVLSARPDDFTIALVYSGGGLSSPNGIAIDATGNAWITNYTASTVTELSNQGAVLSPAGGYSGGGLFQPIAIAIDNSGNAWIADDPFSATTGEVTKISGGTVTGYTGGGLMGPYGIAIDGGNNVWVPNGDNSTVSKFSNSGTSLSGTTGFFAKSTSGSAGLAVDGGGDVWVGNHSTVSRLSNSGVNIAGGDGYSGGGLDSTDAMIALDGSGNAWTTNGFGGAIIEISHAGSFLSGSSGYTGGSLSIPACVAIDGAGNVWVTNYTGSLAGVNLVELSNLGSVLSGTAGYLNAPLVAFEQNAVNVTALDGSGDIWLADNGTNNSVTELIGVATPVITPISAGLPATPTLNGTSNLGSRP